MTPKFRGKVNNGKLELHDPMAYKSYVEGFDGEVVLSITKYKIKNDRSIQQNRYYFGVVVHLISEHTGFTPDEVHEILRSLFLKEEIILKCKTEDHQINISRSTTKLTTVEFEEYLTNIRMWASQELSVFIPLPNEVGY